MKPSVYVETSVIGYLAMRPSSLLVVAAYQKVTRDFWDDYRHEYELFVSEAVIAECSAGDPVAASERRQFLNGIPQLATEKPSADLAKELLRSAGLPQKAETDALHIATATVHGMDYLLTWNCKHIANPALRAKIERACDKMGYAMPEICTPQELMGLDSDV